MEPVQKRAKITSHFRVALRPRDVNVPQCNKLKQPQQPPQQQQHQHHHQTSCKQKIEVITIDDEEEADDLVNKALENRVSEQTANDENTKEEEEKADDGRRADIVAVEQKSPINKYIAPPDIRPNVVDHDKFLLSDIHCEPHYAWDSFHYDRKRELQFRTRKYLDDKQHNHQITPHIRARLVDWLVQIQDSYSLFHETLYMAVKIADQYLMRKTVSRQHLQLLYITSVLISVKFEERLPPVEISDLIQQSGGIYSRKQVISFEVDMLTTLNFNIRFPLSYGFLRRYARCTRSDQKTLTLARYILESSLLEYELIDMLESKLAAGSLLLAFEMLHLDGAWNETAEYYTGYKREELRPLQMKLNDMISRPADKRVSSIRNKYSHKVFLSVAGIPPL